jgi:CheY-like chemotaxis protein
MILLVEDEDDDAFLMGMAMQKIPQPPAMSRVTNGQQAIDYLSGKGEFSDRGSYPLPRLIFLDLKLPLVHGFDVLNWIKSQPALNGIHVAVLTGSLEDIDRERALRLGANSFYIKPPEAQMLKKLFDSIPELLTAE